MSTELKIAKMDRKKYGVSGKPVVADRVLVKKMGHFASQTPPQQAFALLAINTKAGTYTSVNQYNGCTGTGYNAEGMTHPLPDAKSDKWKKWRKNGYVEGNVADFPVLLQAQVAKQQKVNA